MAGCGDCDRAVRGTDGARADLRQGFEARTKQACYFYADAAGAATTFTKVARAQVDQSDRLSDPVIQSDHAALEGFDAQRDPYEVVGLGADGPAGEQAADSGDVDVEEQADAEPDQVLSTA